MKNDIDIEEIFPDPRERSAYRLVQKFGVLTNTAIQLGLKILHPEDAPFDNRRVDRMMERVIEKSTVVIRRRSSRKGLGPRIKHSGQRDKNIRRNAILSPGMKRNAIKLYCMHAKVGISNVRHRMIGNLYLLMYCHDHPEVDLFDDTYSEYEMQISYHMIEFSGQVFARRWFIDDVTGHEPDALICTYRDPDNDHIWDEWVWIEVEGSYKNRARLDALAEVNEHIHFGTTFLAGLPIKAMLFVHGFDDSVYNVVRALIRYTHQQKDDDNDYPILKSSNHVFLELNHRLGIEWYGEIDMLELDAETITSVVWQAIKTGEYRYSTGAGFMEEYLGKI